MIASRYIVVPPSDHRTDAEVWNDTLRHASKVMSTSPAQFVDTVETALIDLLTRMINDPPLGHLGQHPPIRLIVILGAIALLAGCIKDYVLVPAPRGYLKRGRDNLEGWTSKTGLPGAVRYLGVLMVWGTGGANGGLPALIPTGAAYLALITCGTSGLRFFILVRYQVAIYTSIRRRHRRGQSLNTIDVAHLTMRRRWTRKVSAPATVQFLEACGVDADDYAQAEVILFGSPYRVRLRTVEDLPYSPDLLGLWWYDSDTPLSLAPTVIAAGLSEGEVAGHLTGSSPLDLEDVCTLAALNDH